MFRHPLTFAELRAIQDRNLRQRDVIGRLWETKRLRSLVLRAHQLSPEFPRPAGILASCYDDFMAAIAQEPCVVEVDPKVYALLEKWEKKR